MDEKAEFASSLEALNDAVRGKLDGLAEYDLRRPMTPTGTNLLGLVKHLAVVQAGYLGDVFGRPWPEAHEWLGPDAPMNADMFATADESSASILDAHRRSWLHATETIEQTDLDDRGTVPWWPADHRHPTLRTVMLHLLVETARHAGHLDICRELIDGAAGRFDGDPSLPDNREIDWAGYVAELDAIARRSAAS